jgi:hypothetical protein
MQILKGHYSPETAYVVEDYPYGFRLRCKIRYWLEVNNKGTRLWSQTTNPKRGDIWNTPKSSTYSLFGAMYLDEENHVQWNGLSLYDGNKAQAYLDTYGEGLTEVQQARCKNLAELYAGRAAREAAQAPIG